jgi:hypothetical protein
LAAITARLIIDTGTQDTVSIQCNNDRYFWPCFHFGIQLGSIAYNFCTLHYRTESVCWLRKSVLAFYSLFGPSRGWRSGGHKEMSSILAPSYMSPNAGGGGGVGVAGTQPMSTAVHRSPNKLWRFNSILKLWWLSIKTDKFADCQTVEFDLLIIFLSSLPKIYRLSNCRSRSAHYFSIVAVQSFLLAWQQHMALAFNQKRNFSPGTVLYQIQWWAKLLRSLTVNSLSYFVKKIY